MFNEKRLLNEFLALVQIDSETKQERQIADYLTRKLSDLGLDVFEDDTAKSTGHTAGNLIGYLKGTKENVEVIMLNCHMDTVAPGNGVKPAIKDGYVVSDGTTILGADDKAGIAALLEALQVLKENKLPHGDIQVIITIGEETSLTGASALNPNHLKAKYGYALDTGGKVGSIKASAPAHATFDVDVFGKTAHAGVAPENGVSAIQIAAVAIAKLPLGRIDEETTANIGSFEAKGPLNVVTDYTRVRAEARSFNKDKLEQQLSLMKEAFETAANELNGRVDIKTNLTFPNFNLDENDPVIKIAKRAAEKIGRSCDLIKAGGGSDANIFNGYGVPTGILTCGYELIHTTEERMPIKELNKLTEMTLAIIAEVASASDSAL